MTDEVFKQYLEGPFERDNFEDYGKKAALNSWRPLLSDSDPAARVDLSQETGLDVAYRALAGAVNAAVLKTPEPDKKAALHTFGLFGGTVKPAVVTPAAKDQPDEPKQKGPRT